jgi:hypothetical protein
MIGFLSPANGSSDSDDATSVGIPLLGHISQSLS